MKKIIANIFAGGGASLNYLLAAVTACAMCAAMPSFAADRTISANYTLTTDETVDGVLTVPSGVTVDLNGHHLTVQGLAGSGTITCDPDFVLPDLTAPDPNGERVTCNTTTYTGTGATLFNNNKTYSSSNRLLVKAAELPLDVIYDFGEGTPQKVDKYKIYFGCAGSSYRTRGPRDWTFSGSNDKTNWTTLDTRSGETWSTTTANRDYDIDPTKVAEYRYYRINITASSAGTGASSYLELVQLEYFDTSARPELHIAVPQGETSTNSTVEISGSVVLVKDGPGKFVSSKPGQTYTGGTLHREGTFGIAGTASLDWSQFTFGTDPAKSVALEFGPTATLSPVPATWYVGNAANITSAVVKAGGDWTFSGDVSVASGSGAVASLYLNGGNISAASLYVGDNNNSGHAGTGYCEISGGTVTCSGASIIGRYSDGDLVVTNGGSLVASAASTFYLGHNATGTVTVADGGFISVGEIKMCNNSSNASGTLNIGRGGLVLANNAWRNKAGSAAVNFDGGTFKKARGTGNFFSANGANAAIDVTVSANGGTLDNNSLSATLPRTITGEGGMTFSGSGTTTVSANQEYLGLTTVSNETTLSVSGVTFAGPVMFEAGSKFDIASATPGVAALTADYFTFPYSDTVPLTFNGGAFPVGVYAVCSATGLTAADGAKFSVSSGDFNTSWSVEDGALVLTVRATTQTWNGAAGESASWNGSSWSGGAWADNVDAVFATEGAIASVDSDVTANSVIFNAGATVNGSATLTPNVVFVAEGKTATINAPTAGALEKTGLGSLTLTQNRTAATTVTAGTLKMDGATLSSFTLGTDGGAPVVFDYGGQSLQKDPASYLVTGSDVTLTNGTFWMSGAMSIRDSTKIPSVLTIAKDATLRQTGNTANSLIIDKDDGTATINVVGGTFGKTSGNNYAYLQHASINGRLNINVTDGGLLIHNSSRALYALCCGNYGMTPSLYMMFSDSTFYVADTFKFGNDTVISTAPTGVLAATNSVITIAGTFALGRNLRDEKTEGSYTADFENCIVTSRYFGVYHDRPLNNVRFNGTRFVFRDTGSIGTSDGADNWITVGGNGLTLDTQAFSCNLGANLGGSGAVTKVGGGTLTVTSNQTASAAFNVNEGTLAVKSGVSVSRPITIASGATLSVNATDTATIDTLTLEAGSTLNIASYDGHTPLATTALTLPAEGTVNLTLNGGAFAKGVYAIYSKSGVTAADGAKFTPSTGGETLSWSVENNTLILTVGAVDPNAWTGLSGDGRMSTPGNWAGNAVPAADADIDLSVISADTTLIADAERTFGRVTMGTGVITFTNSFTASSFVSQASPGNPTKYVAVAPDSTVTIDGDLEFATNQTVYICYTVAEGGTFAVTGDIVGTSAQTTYITPCQTDSIEGVISAKGLVHDCATKRAFGLTRGKENSHVQWLIGEDGISGSKEYAIGDSSGATATITAATNFTVSAGIVQYRGLTFDTAGYEITLGTDTSAKSGGIFGGSANGLTTITGSGKVIVNYKVDDLTTTTSSMTNAFTVASAATLAFAPGGNIGTGALTIQGSGTLELQSGTTTHNGALTLEDGAMLAFNFTDGTAAPVLALDSGSPTVNGAVAVKLPVRPKGGDYTLTTCGGFNVAGASVSIADMPKWASVDVGNGNIEINVKPRGLLITVR